MYIILAWLVYKCRIDAEDITVKSCLLHCRRVYLKSWSATTTKFNLYAEHQKNTALVLELTIIVVLRRKVLF